MTEKQHNTAQGAIHYWTNDIRPERQSLVFLPGLTADHRLFDSQVRRFEPTHNVVVWDVVNSDFVNHAIAIICSGYD